MPGDNDLDPVDRWLEPAGLADGAAGRRVRADHQARRGGADAPRRDVRRVGRRGRRGGGSAATLGLSRRPRDVRARQRCVIAASGSAATPSSTGTQKTLGTATSVPTRKRQSASSSALPTPRDRRSRTTLVHRLPRLPAGQVHTGHGHLGRADHRLRHGPGRDTGQCGAQGNSDICTSIAITHDSGLTWAGVRAAHRSGDRPGRRQPDAVPRRGGRLGVRARTVRHA